MEADRWKVAQGQATVVYAREPFPEEVTRTIFLAGPTPRGKGEESWRPGMVELLQREGFDGHIFVPEPRDGQWAEDYQDQVEWEEEGLHRADCILFWVPRDLHGDRGPELPGLTTNDEWGFWKDSGKVVWGSPPMADKTRYQKHYAQKFGAPVALYQAHVARAAVELVGEGAQRAGGEAQVPLHIWRKPEFQAWLKALRGAGNRLDGARVVWAFRVPPPDFNDGKGPPKRTFLYALHVSVHIGAEDRNKTNEIVLFRPDIASVVLYHRPVEAYLDARATKVVLVKEFRSPVRNAEGYVYELPGGSSTKEVTLEQLAAEEVQEELGVEVDPARLIPIGQRQIGATLSAHTSTVFAVELTAEEMAKLEAQQAKGETHGVAKDSELTYTQVQSVGELLASETVDWAMMGMVLSALVRS